MKEKFLEAGRIVGTHGVKGELRVEPWVDSPEFLKRYKKLYLEGGRQDLGLISSRVHKNLLLIRVAGVDTATQGDLLRGKTVYIDREEVPLPENRYFIADLIGLEVYDAQTGRFYGKIEEVLPTGANPVYVIRNGGQEYLFPAVDHMIRRTDPEAGRIEVLPIPGIFDSDAVIDK